jgi:DNA-binding NarL/FixJ family response regulator
VAAARPPPCPAEEALAAITETAPDVVLMDINLPGASGVEATRRASQIAPGTAVLVVTMVDDDDTVFAALAAGARGYVLKGASADEITAALRTVAAGGAVFGAGVATRLLAHTPRRLPGPASPSRPDDLTMREREVLDLLAEGASNQRSPAPSNLPEDRAEPRLPHPGQAPGR